MQSQVTVKEVDDLFFFSMVCFVLCYSPRTGTSRVSWSARHNRCSIQVAGSIIWVYCGDNSISGVSDCGAEQNTQMFACITATEMFGWVFLGPNQPSYLLQLFKDARIIKFFITSLSKLFEDTTGKQKKSSLSTSKCRRLLKSDRQPLLSCYKQLNMRLARLSACSASGTLY